ncbi:MAG: hypothetical protein F6J87_15440 [Spirulina sp. SIO3F2]|nr:hypothetical protein [Spirulina sp. SIO3F2]
MRSFHSKHHAALRAWREYAPECVGLMLNGCCHSVVLNYFNRFYPSIMSDRLSADIRENR